MAKKTKFHISFNAPVTLAFCFICTLILVLDKTLLSKFQIVDNWFTVPGAKGSSAPFNFSAALDYIKLLSHVLGHTDWNHLVANLTFILLLGPLLEERYGSVALALMIIATALVTGVLNACFIPSALLGSSGIAFMMILLSSFASIQKHEIPVSFILVFLMFMGREFFLAKNPSGISTLAHIAGGLCGSLFGFLVAPKSVRAKEKAVREQKKDSGTNLESYEEELAAAPKGTTRTVVKTDDETIVGTLKF
ncbi:MAG: rhomboid family intramembrane serine protease [Treponema sp.]|nr:rhomboid family intramembrane serine protease [Treponema sp.]